MKRKIFVISCALSIGATFAAPALADVFRCVAPAGEVSYGDSPCDENTVASANLTEAVRTCDTEACEVALQQSREQSIARLREERAALTQMQDMRLRAEAHELDRQLKLAQLERLQAADEQPVGALGGVWLPAHGLHDVDGRCRGGHCGRPGAGAGDGHGGGHGGGPRSHGRKQGGVSFR